MGSVAEMALLLLLRVQLVHGLGYRAQLRLHEVVLAPYPNLDLVVLDASGHRQLLTDYRLIELLLGIYPPIV